MRNLLCFTTILLMAGVLACAPPSTEEPSAGETPSAAASVAGSSAAGPEVVDPQANIMPSGMGAVYFSIKNPGAESDRLVAVETPSAKAAETHESLEEDGVMRMVPHPDGFEIPAGGTLALEPGGKHIMLIEPQVEEGADSILLILHLERAGKLEVEAPLMQMGGMDHGEMDHGDMDHGDSGDDMSHDGMDHAGTEPGGDHAGHDMEH